MPFKIALFPTLKIAASHILEISIGALLKNIFFTLSYYQCIQ